MGNLAVQLRKRNLAVQVWHFIMEETARMIEETARRNEKKELDLIWKKKKKKSAGELGTRDCRAMCEALHKKKTVWTLESTEATCPLTPAKFKRKIK